MRLRQFLIFTLLVWSCIAYSQEPATFQLHVEGTITNLEDTPMPGAVIQVMQGGKVIQSITTDGSGSYAFDLPLNSDYTINVTKPGHVTKKFQISTKGVPPERAQTKFGTIEASLSLFEKMDGIDYSSLNQPMNKYNYNPNKENFEYDKAYLDQMLASLEAVMAAQQAAIEKAKRLERDYQAAIKAGDKAFQKNDWNAAKAAYNQASSLKPNENWPKDQMAQIEKIIKELEALNKKKEEDAKKAADDAAKAKADAELNAKYAAAIKKGDDAFNAKNWAAAKLGYNEAIGFKPGEQYPKDKLAAIDKAIADEAAAKNKAEIDAKYAAAVKKGDDAFTAKNWAVAKSGYNEALGFKPAEQYPKDKLAAIDKALADEAAAKAKTEEEAKAKAELEAKYAAAIKRGDEGFAKKDWLNAKGAYSEALTLKANEQYPKTQLAAIEKAIADDAAAKAKADVDAKAKAELEAKYTAAIKKGDDAFAKKDWTNSKAGYNEALTIKANEQYPKDKLAAIDKAIADENAAKSKAELDAKYTAAIKKGDDAFSKKDWTNAKAGYNEALTLKANEQYPKDKLAAIEKAIANDEAAKAKAYADAKAELEAKYAAAIKKGDDAFKTKNWATAKLGYNDALAIKSAEQYPKDQLAAIDKAIADENANKSKAELDAKYNTAIKNADAAFAKKDWNTAKTGYNEALGIKPGEQYPKDKLVAIEKAIADELANKSKGEVDAKYNAAIKNADAAFAKKDWNTAKAGYNEALTIKPGEQYPQDKLAAIEKAIADELANKSKGEIDAKYNAAIKKGDDAFTKRDWVNAKSGFIEASVIKPTEQYPKVRLAAIEAEIAKADEAKAAAELKAKYDAIIKTADAQFNKKSYSEAKASYYEALQYLPDEKYPKMQIGAINKLMSGETNAAEQKYKEAIAKGDNNFTGKNFKEAKKNYEEALTYKGGDAYAKGRLVEIEKLLNSDGAVKTDDHIKALLAKYSQGVTEETINGTGVVIIQRVVVKGQNAWVYQKKVFSWGGISYFRDGNPITELIFENETKP